MSASIEQRNQDATLWVGNLDEQVEEELLWELFLQAGPVVSLHMPKDKVTSSKKGICFVEFRSEEDAEYAKLVMNMVKLFGKPIKVNNASQDRQQMEIGANLFIGGLAEEVDEKLLYDTFSAFGTLTETPKVLRDPDTGQHKGFGFVAFESFEAADLAIECMNQQYLCNRAIQVQYAFKKDSQGERHGSQAERMLAANRMHGQVNKLMPHTMFAASAGQVGTSQGYQPAPPAPPQMGFMPPPPMHQFAPPPPPPAQMFSNMGMAPPPPPPPMHMMGVPPPPPMHMMGVPPPPPPPMNMGAPPPPPPPMNMGAPPPPPPPPMNMGAPPPPPPPMNMGVPPPAPPPPMNMMGVPPPPPPPT